MYISDHGVQTICMVYESSSLCFTAESWAVSEAYRWWGCHPRGVLFVVSPFGWVECQTPVKEWFAFLVCLHVQGTWKLVTARSGIMLTLNCIFLRPIRNLNDLTVHINIFRKYHLWILIVQVFFLRSCLSVAVQKEQSCYRNPRW